MNRAGLKLLSSKTSGLTLVMSLNRLLASWLNIVIFISSARGTILSSSKRVYYVGAIVAFNITDQDGNTLKKGSLHDHHEIGKYGASSPDKNVSGLIVHAYDGAGSDYGCEGSHYQDAAQEENWIAFVQRGKCTFVEKISQASKANASAIIIYDKGEDVVVMSHEGADDIVSVIIPRKLGREIARRVDVGDRVTASIETGQKYWSPSKDKTSIIFVSLSFLILMVISLTWLIVYYVQRFRLVQTPGVLKQRREQARQLVNTLQKKLLKQTDKEVKNEEICPICIENYRADDVLRILPCEHFFHRKCVDPWLCARETCPMCKRDVLKPLGLPPLPLNPGFIFRTPPTSAVDWEHASRRVISSASSSTDSLVPVQHEDSMLVTRAEPDNSGDAGCETRPNYSRDAAGRLDDDVATSVPIA